jgi:hypothetical protein
MGKRILFLMILPVLVLALAGVSYGWQGRMGGMGDPFGLVEDESDFLIHPAKIAKGEGIKFYGDYRFTFTGETDWDDELDIFLPTGTLINAFPRGTSERELRHEALMGSSFPLGPGRMGLFFQYSGKRGDYDGKQEEFFAPATFFHDKYDLQSDLDNFALRLLYGLPVGGLKLGGEVQFAYRQEEQEIIFNEDFGAGVRWLWTNPFAGGLALSGWRDFFFFMLPYESRYWEALLKGSLEGKVGPLDLEFTLKGGFLFAGDNTYEYQRQTPIGTLADSSHLRGDVRGWRLGGDVWARYPLAQDLSLPFLVSIDFQEKTRDGDGPSLASGSYSYNSQERRLHLTIGGGLDKELSKVAKIAGGIYYNYLQGNNDIQFKQAAGGFADYNYTDFPSSFESQVMLKLAGEFELSPLVTLRMGLTPFIGWVREDYTFSFLASPAAGLTDDVSTDGLHWGIGASLGGTIKFKPITVEPFINYGWQQLHLKGNGDSVINTGVVTRFFEMNKDRDEWSIGGGFSVLFGL